MSRLIKKYSYNEKFRDEIGEYAENIKNYPLPAITVKEVRMWDHNINFLNSKMAVEAWAEEDKKGVHLKCSSDNASVIVAANSATIVIDEERFCDSAYECAMHETELQHDSFIQESLKQLAAAYIKQSSTRHIYFQDTEYVGNGAIFAGDNQIIGFFHSISFINEKLHLNKYIGEIDFKNLENIKIVFFSGEKALSIESMSYEHVSADGELYCLQFDLNAENIKFEFDVQKPVEFEELGVFDFNTGSEEEYYKQRNDMLNRLEEEMFADNRDVNQLVDMLLDDSL